MELGHWFCAARISYECRAAAPDKLQLHGTQCIRTAGPTRALSPNHFARLYQEYCIRESSFSAAQSRGHHAEILQHQSCTCAACLNSAGKSAGKAVALLVLRINVYRVASSLAATGSSRDSQQRCRLPQGHRHRVQSNPNNRTAGKAHLRLGGVSHFRGRRQPLQQAARGGGLARVSPAGPPSLGCWFRRRLPERRPGAFEHSMEHAAQLVVAPTVPVTGIDSTVIA